MIGIKSKNYILKDIGRTIQRHGFFLPPVSFEKITHYHTPKEYVLAIMPSAGLLGVNLNTLDLNMAFFICELLRVTSRQDWKYLKSLSHDVVSGLFSLNVLFEGAKAEDVVAAYYQHSLINELDSEEVGQYAKDYGRMCIRNDYVSIFHWNYAGGSYTIQFGKDQFGLFRVDEIKGKYNVECSVAILRRLNDILLQIHE